MSKKKQKFYVVWKGIIPGIYATWDECQLQIIGYVGALYKSFDTIEEAEKAIKQAPHNHIGKTAQKQLPQGAKPIVPSICVDAACAGVPGPMEYRGVITHNKKELFRLGPFPDGTNNIGEFLAIVHGLALLKNQNSNVPIYTDSKTAMAWVRDKKCKTKHLESLDNKNIFELIRRAEYWLLNNTFSNQIIKWPTEIWGEIPADFGRK